MPVRARECVYLVSSSASREYVLDCVEALALPRGMVQHFRYRRKYLAKNLAGLLRQGPNRLCADLKDLPVVVVYLYQAQRGGHWNPEEKGDRYSPLRCGRLIDAFFDGEVAHFYFEVNDYVKPPDRRRPKRVEQPVWAARKSLNDKIQFQSKEVKGKAIFYYACLGPDLSLAATGLSDTSAFQRFVDDAYRRSEWRTRSSGSAPLDVTYDVVFVQVDGLFLERGHRLVRMVPSLTALQWNPFAEYKLDAGKIYHIKVVTHLFARFAAELPGQGNATLSLQFDPDIIKPAGPTSFRISSTYDLHYWPIVAACENDQRTTLKIACETSGSANGSESFVRKELLCPEICLPISIVAHK